MTISIICCTISEFNQFIYVHIFHILLYANRRQLFFLEQSHSNKSTYVNKKVISCQIYIIKSAQSFAFFSFFCDAQSFQLMSVNEENVVSGILPSRCNRCLFDALNFCLKKGEEFRVF